MIAKEDDVCNCKHIHVSVTPTRMFRINIKTVFIVKNM